MLQLKEISKQYKTGNLTQNALDGVSLNLRDNEFVAILGPSGSGKTTMLNIVGGLDRYDSGDLIINGISTKEYKDRDWDSYRNHTIGFVFQSYNLIPHQTVLSNVELALTISGISRTERRKRAAQALEQVGLGNQLHKKPNQMSGGQMQRVAIARALVNDPDILLADEPTGALDTDTSVQVMELLKKVAKDRLVVMVTHNPELAEQYATRIVKLRDGKILDDSDPFEVDEKETEPPQHKNMGRSSMSMLTALSLSFNNLRTKKARTLLTSFAGSIGIIGIALISSLSNGVNTYIEDLQKETMTSYPISIDAETIDLSSLMSASTHKAKDEADHELDGVYPNNTQIEAVSNVTSSITKNNLTEFKKYLDDPKSEIHDYVGENGIMYSYSTKFSVYSYDSENAVVNTDGTTLNEFLNRNSGYGMMGNMSSSSIMSSYTNMNCFEELIKGSDGKLVSPAITDSYDIVYGSWPESYDEVVIVLDKNNEISAPYLYRLGLLPTSQYKDIMSKIQNGEKVELDSKKWNYDEICSHTFYLVPACDTYTEKSNGLYKKIVTDDIKVRKLIEENAVKLKIKGIIRPKNEDNKPLKQPVGYTSALTDYIIEYTNNSAVVKAQKNSKEKNVLTGTTFSPSDNKQKAADTLTYINNLSVSEQAELGKRIFSSTSGGNTDQLQNMTDEMIAGRFTSFLKSANVDTVAALYDLYISGGSYEDNMRDFGVVDKEVPSSISIYVDSFEAKESVTKCIDDYNKIVSEDDKITYTDYIGLLMSSVTTIVNVISYVLIAFVSVSLIVSSIMIGIITYISVLERTKEIGILRAIGASKHNISQVFNAETFIIGLCSGLIGIGITLILLIPANAIIHYVAETDAVSASLPVMSALLLILLSVLLTFIGGLIPSRKAAKKDPVTALRTE